MKEALGTLAREIERSVAKERGPDMVADRRPWQP
jgi:hypothetical protein